MPTLDWIGKEAVRQHHHEVPFHLLREVPDLGAGDPEAGNLLVKGDNLVALKALLPSYAGQVKCVYIDPPYNKGTEHWEYNDNVNSPAIREWLGKVVGKEAEDLGRHDKWLCMMYPRLVLLRQFLREDGVILVSLDDYEIGNARVLLSEVFGEQNRIATLVWEKGKKGDADFVGVTHDYVLVYAKSKRHLKSMKTKWRRKKPGVDRVLEHYAQVRRRHATDGGYDHESIREEMMAWYRDLPNGDPAKAHKHYNWSDDRHLYFAADISGPDDGRDSRPRHDILHPVTGKPTKKPRTGWRWDEDRTRAALAEDPPLIHFGADETTIPNRKSYLRNKKGEPFPSVFYRDGRAGTAELKKVVDGTEFQFPKDPDVIADLIGLVTGPDDLVLDSFAGSGTTGHAVLKLNEREGSNRRFVLIELEEHVAADTTLPRLRGVVEGYDYEGEEKVQLFREKIDVSAFKRAAAIWAEADLVKEANEGVYDGFARAVEDGEFRLYGKRQIEGRAEGLGGGFRVYEIGEPVYDADGRLNEAVPYEALGRYAYFAQAGRPLDDSVAADPPLVGVTGDGTAVYLLGGPASGDGAAPSGVLDRAALGALPAHDGPRVVWGTACRLGADLLEAHGVTFRQVPYDLRTA